MKVDVMHRCLSALVLVIFTILASSSPVLAQTGGDHVVSEWPRNTAIKYGEDGRLNCTVRAGAEYLRIDWDVMRFPSEIKNIYIGRKTSATVLEEDKYAATPDKYHDLKVKSAAWEHSGGYRCVVVETDMDIFQRNVVLTVVEKPECSTGDPNVDKVEGDTVNLDCSIRFRSNKEQYFAPTLKWYDESGEELRDGFDIVQPTATPKPEPDYSPIQKVYRVNKTANGVTDDGKKFTCRVSFYGITYEDICDTSFRVKYPVTSIRFEPEYIQGYPPLHVKVGDHINCTVKANPPARFQWRKLNLDVGGPDIVEGDRLDIVEDMIGGISEYECQATNAVNGQPAETKRTVKFDTDIVPVVPADKSSAVTTVVGVTVGVALSIVCIIAAIFFFRWKRRQQDQITKDEPSYEVNETGAIAANDGKDNPTYDHIEEEMTCIPDNPTYDHIEAEMTCIPDNPTYDHIEMDMTTPGERQGAEELQHDWAEPGDIEIPEYIAIIGGNSGEETATDESNYMRLLPVIPGNSTEGTYAKLNRKTDVLANVSDEMKRKVDEFILDMEELVYVKDLEKGFFGMIHLCRLITDNKVQEVAVKSLTVVGFNRKAHLEAFLDEAVKVKDFRHKHVLTPLGIVFHLGKPKIVLPYMLHGDLKTFLNTMMDKQGPFDPVTLLRFCRDVAEGMSYLSRQRFAHMDLAARNCMVDGDLVVKVADFGMTHDLYQKSYYRVSQSKPLPVRWMAPESISTNVFTCKSDVWSYGIVMWEIFTHGEIPYSHLNNGDLLMNVMMGTLDCLYTPVRCPPKVYSMMCSCWDTDPDARPRFSAMKSEIEAIVADLTYVGAGH